MTREEIEKKAQELDDKVWRSTPPSTLTPELQSYFIEMAEWSARKFLEFAEANAIKPDPKSMTQFAPFITLSVLRSYLEGKL